MKRRLVQEGLIYCILPVIAIGGFYNQYRGIPWMILGVGFLYTFYTKRREDRINYTFLTFLILFNTYYIMTNNIKGDILLEAMDFSICKIAFQDILMMLGESKMGVYKVSKKSKVDLNLKKLSTIIILELLCCDLIGIYYINIKNITNLSYMISYEILVIIIFTLVEMYQLSLIRSKVKYIKYKNKKLIKEKVDLGKVINLEQYR